MTRCPSFSSSRRRLLAVAGLAALGGCASPARILSGEQSALLNRTGRFAVSVDYSGGKQEAVQGGFAWQDTGRQLTLDLANPMGTTLARVTVQPGSALLVRADGSRQSAPSADALIEQVLGSPMPVGGLRYWLRGETAPQGVSHAQRDPQGRFTYFEQSGWLVQLSRYDAQGPLLLRMNRNESQRSISVRLVVDA